MDSCYICGRIAHHTHHVFQGVGRRKLSDIYGLTVRLCPECHHNVHSHPRDYVWLKEEFQRKAMKENNWSIDQFIEKFGRSYIDAE